MQSRISAFIGSCWDLGLQIGSSVRTVSDCLNESAGDITVQTSLLERRLISGPPALYQQLSAAYDSAMQPYAFYLAKTLEMRQRHAKFDNTPYSLEPNCKESPGGLRDLHIVLWVAKAAGYGTTWDALTRNGLMTRYEAKQIKRNYTLLSLIRARLHLVANRREDRLVFDLQTLVAEQFGYTAIPRQTRQGHDRSPIRPSEALMRHYYWTAKAVTQLSQILLLNIAERLRDSGHTRNYDPAPVTRAMRALQARTEKQAQPSQEAGAQLAAQEVVSRMVEHLVQDERLLPSVQRVLDSWRTSRALPATPIAHSRRRLSVLSQRISRPGAGPASGPKSARQPPCTVTRPGLDVQLLPSTQRVLDNCLTRRARPAQPVSQVRERPLLLSQRTVDGVTVARVAV